MATKMVTTAPKHFVNGDINYTSDTIKAMLLIGHTWNQDTDEYISAVNAQQVSGTGYTAGGATLASKTVNVNTGTNVTNLDAADPSWTTSTITADSIAFYKDTGTDSTSPIIAYDEFAIASSGAGTFTYTINAGGFATITPA